MALRIEPGGEPIPGYKLIERIGGGGFGEVWSCEAPGGLLKAIKIVYGDLQQADPDGTRRAEQELKALKRVQSVRHPYLLSLERYDIVEHRLLIVMELADRNLWDRFRECRTQGMPGIPRDELLRYMEESAEVLDMMNSEHQLQHLDIKPQNIFMVHNHAKVADFGLVKDLEGMMATVTGGITPVYAAPETFDGKVSRFCDQYSLAIVYEELLTGQRPFSGTSLQQLIMQHLSAQPNLSPLPKGDRPIIARGLAKKSEARYPTIFEMVQALRNAGNAAPYAPSPGRAPARAVEAAPLTSSRPPSPAPSTPPSPEPVTPPSLESRPAPAMLTPPPTPLGFDITSSMRADTSGGRIIGQEEAELAVEDSAPVPPAAAKTTGDGVLFPALVIGLGLRGMEALQTLRTSLQDHFGSPENQPHLRMLYIDTDPDTVQGATAGQFGGGLSANETILTRLNRPSHYLRPGTGRSSADSWINGKLLYRIPRNPATTGMRCLGRLAFVDHYRAIVARLRSDLEMLVKPETLAQAAKLANQSLRSNYPRVYVVTSLTGGTGSGMFIDVAYVVRKQLKQMGYAQPDVVSVLFLPSVNQQPPNTVAIGNTVAALTELNHFSTGETPFTFRFDDKEKRLKDKEPPFGRTIFLPLEPENKARSGEAARLAGDFIYRDLMTPLGRTAEGARPAVEAPDADASARPIYQTLGVYRFTWPRRTVLQRAARYLCQRLAERWNERDATSVREGVKQWLGREITAKRLEAEHVIGELHDACEKQLGQAPEDVFVDLAEPFVPKGRRGPDPDPDAVMEAIRQMHALVGNPEQRPAKGKVIVLDDAMEKASLKLVKAWGPKFGKLALSLIDEPDFRLRGAEEAIRQLTSHIDETLESYDALRRELEEQADDRLAQIEELLETLAANPGGGRRTVPVVAELTEMLKQYPRLRYQALVLKRVGGVYTSLRGNLSDQVREVTFCRQRLGELVRAFEDPLDSGTRSDPVPGRCLLPPGFGSVDDAIAQVVDDLTDDDVRELDHQVEDAIRQQFTSLVQVCLTSSSVVKALEVTMHVKAQAFVGSRVGGGNVVQMFLAEHDNDQEGAIREIATAFQQAAPELATKEGSKEPEIRILALPPGDLAQQFRGLVRKGLPEVQMGQTDSSDDIVFYREQPDMPLTSLAILGQRGQDAYQQMLGADNFSPHNREDVEEWGELKPQ